MHTLSSQTIPILLGLIAAVAGACANWFYKVGAEKFSELAWYRNWYILEGLISFIAVLILFLWAFRLGGRLFIVYPVYATTYIWAGLLGIYVDNEPWSVWQLIGVGLIMAGVSLVSIGHPR